MQRARADAAETALQQQRRCAAAALRAAVAAHETEEAAHRDATRQEHVACVERLQTETQRARVVAAEAVLFAELGARSGIEIGTLDSTGLGQCQCQGPRHRQW